MLHFPKYLRQPAARIAGAKSADGHGEYVDRFRQVWVGHNTFRYCITRTNDGFFRSPTPKGIPIDFPPVTLNNHRLIDITNDGHIEIANPNREAIDFWDTLYEEHETHFQEVC